MATASLGNKWANRLNKHFEREFLQGRGWNEDEVQFDFDKEDSTQYIWSFEYDGKKYRMSICKATDKITVTEA